MTNPGVDRAGLAANAQSSESAWWPGPGMRGFCGSAGLLFQLTVGIWVMTPEMPSLPVLCRGQEEKRSPASKNLCSECFLGQVVPDRAPGSPPEVCLNS